MWFLLEGKLQGVHVKVLRMRVGGLVGGEVARRYCGSGGLLGLVGHVLVTGPLKHVTFSLV